jgi:hypothetical protein
MRPILSLIALAHLALCCMHALEHDAPAAVGAAIIGAGFAFAALILRRSEEA